MQNLQLCLVLLTDKSSSVEGYGCNDITGLFLERYQWHSHCVTSRGPARHETKCFSGRRNYLLNLSMLLNSLICHVCRLQCNNILWKCKFKTFDFHVVLCIIEYVTSICMRHYCCIHSLCLLVLFAQWIWKWMIPVTWLSILELHIHIYKNNNTNNQLYYIHLYSTFQKCFTNRNTEQLHTLNYVR